MGAEKVSEILKRVGKMEEMRLEERLTGVKRG